MKNTKKQQTYAYHRSQRISRTKEIKGREEKYGKRTNKKEQRRRRRRRNDWFFSHTAA